MEILIKLVFFYVAISLLASLLGIGRQGGYREALFWNIVATPLVGWIIVLLSSKDSAYGEGVDLLDGDDNPDLVDDDPDSLDDDSDYY